VVLTQGMKAIRHLRAIWCIGTCIFFATSCTEDAASRHFDTKNLEMIDPVGELTREDFRGMRDPKSLNTPPGGRAPSKTDLKITAGVSEPPVPELAEILAAPKPPKIGSTQLVSVAVSDDVPLKDVLIELARLADVDIEVDAGISGGVSFRAKDRPFNEVIERVADLANLRYSIKNGVLRVERDTPYIQTYTLDMLNLDRNSTSNIGLNSAGGGSAAGGSAAGTGTTGTGAAPSANSRGARNSSSSSISMQSRSDFWVKFEDSVRQILSYTPVRMTSAATIASQPAPVFDSGSPPENVNTASNAAAPVSDPDATESPAAPAAEATPATATTPAATTTGSTALVMPATGTFYSLNRQAGTLMVAATERQHEIIKRFLKEIETNASSQVLIEAKIVEVALNESYQSGINWSRLGNGSVSYTGLFDTVSASTANAGVTPASFTVLSERLFGTGVDLSAAVRMLDEFGTTRALSSPRLNAMNNQQAVLTFAEKIVYFKVRIRVTAAVAGTGGSVGAPAIVEVNSEENHAPVGILLSLLPTINKETNEVTLSVRPTLTRVTQFITDPSFPIQVAVALNRLNNTDAELIEKIRNTDSRVPQIETRELDSILKLKSGQVMVIGGLLEDRITNNDAGVPAVSDIPFFGNLFKSVEKMNTKKELVIFIRATIVDAHGNVTDSQKALYNKFIQDPDPLRF
jgi:MSHA type pilus biogenesis protein MshL